MYALALNGSPQRNGPTKVFLEQVLAPLTTSGWKTEMVHLGCHPLASCNGCTKCFRRNDGLCALESDNFNPIYAKMLKSNAIILGSPAGFNANLVPEVNNFIGRSAYLSTANKSPLAGKVGTAIISVAQGNFIEAQDKAQRFFLRSKMIVPGISGWNTDALRLHRHKRESKEEVLEEMKKIGEMINWLARAIQPSLRDLPQEKAVAPPPARVSAAIQLPPGSISLMKRDPNLPMLLQDMYSEPQGR